MSTRFLSILSPTVLLWSTLAIFGPFSIYAGNVGEIDVSLAAVIASLLLPSLVLGLILVAVGTLLPGRWHERLVAVLFCAGALAWFQGNILVWDYGVFGRGDVDLSAGAWRGWVDSTIWIVCLAGAAAFASRVYPVTTFASLLLVLLQAGVLAIGSVRTPGVWRSADSRTTPPEALFQFSSTRNVIHIILDELQTDVFQSVVDQNAGHYESAFQGFTLFADNAGSFPTTLMSVPAALSGRIYGNDVPIDEFIDDVYRGRTIPNVLHERGYDVDLVSSLPWYEKGRHTNWYQIPTPYDASAEEIVRVNTKYFAGIVMMRHAPHFLKKAVLERTGDASLIHLGDIASYDARRHLANRVFLQDLIDRMSVSREEPSTSSSISRRRTGR